MCESLRRALVVVPFVVLSLIVATGCASKEVPEGAVATSGGGPATIGIETSSMYVTVQNNAGAPLEDVQVAIMPVGGVLKFTSSLSRMENGEKRDIALGKFRGSDGTTFSPRIYKPKQVTVTAKDIVGKTHARSMAWR